MAYPAAYLCCRCSSAVLAAAAVFLPDVSFDHPHAGLIGLDLGVLGNPELGFMPGFDVAVIEGEIGGLYRSFFGSSRRAP